jgi:hypothetical protein
MSKNSNGGNTSIDSNMDDTPSNYNIANQRLGGEHNKIINNKTVRIDEETSVINSQLGEDTQRRKRIGKRKKKVV